MEEHGWWKIPSSIGWVLMDCGIQFISGIQTMAWIRYAIAFRQEEAGWT
jgi:hypothetical protein